MWGMDVIGPISPKASNGHRFIFVAIDYFTKWVKAASYASVTRAIVVRFLKKEIICRYGMPERIISDNAKNLNNTAIEGVCKQFKIQHHNSVPYRLQMNGAVEATNKNIKKIVAKMAVTYKDWHEKLSFALLAYRTSVRTSTGATPFSLVYRMEAVLPIEVEIPSLRVLSELNLEEAEWIQARYDQLNLIEEKRLKAIQHGPIYQKRMVRAYDKRVRPRELQEGDLVLKRPSIMKKDPRGKWKPNWEGPYVVKKAFSGGALILTEMDGGDLRNPINVEWSGHHLQPSPVSLGGVEWTPSTTKSCLPRLSGVDTSTIVSTLKTAAARMSSRIDLQPSPVSLGGVEWTPSTTKSCLPRWSGVDAIYSQVLSPSVEWSGHHESCVYPEQAAERI
ncbi:hypothetical protein V6N13_107857 [Hibiscus sabdariffa]